MPVFSLSFFLFLLVAGREIVSSFLFFPFLSSVSIFHTLSSVLSSMSIKVCLFFFLSCRGLEGGHGVTQECFPLCKLLDNFVVVAGQVGGVPLFCLLGNCGELVLDIGQVHQKCGPLNTDAEALWDLLFVLA